MSSRNILALAVLTAGVSLLAVGTAQAATNCGKAVSVLEAPTTVAALCDEVTDVRANGTYGGKMSAPADSELLMNVDALAKALGLPGLSRAAAVLSIADMAGVAAGAGLPTLPGGLPGTAGLPNVASLAQLPDTPGLPSVPGLAAVPQLPVSKLPALPYASGLTSVKAPLTLPQPVQEVKDKVTAVVPQVPAAVKKVESAVPQSSTTGGIGSLLKTLKLS